MPNMKYFLMQGHIRGDFVVRNKVWQANRCELAHSGGNLVLKGNCRDVVVLDQEIFQPEDEEGIDLITLSGTVLHS